jgi:hypothetical protein
MKTKFRTLVTTRKKAQTSSSSSAMVMTSQQTTNQMFSLLSPQLSIRRQRQRLQALHDPKREQSRGDLLERSCGHAHRRATLLQLAGRHRLVERAKQAESEYKDLIHRDELLFGEKESPTRDRHCLAHNQLASAFQFNRASENPL